MVWLTDSPLFLCMFQLSIPLPTCRHGLHHYDNTCQPIPWPACGPLNSRVVLSCTRATQRRKPPEHTWGQRGRPQTCLLPVCTATAAFGWVLCTLLPAVSCTELAHLSGCCTLCAVQLPVKKAFQGLRAWPPASLQRQPRTPTLHVFSLMWCLVHRRFQQPRHTQSWQCPPPPGPSLTQVSEKSSVSMPVQSPPPHSQFLVTMSNGDALSPLLGLGARVLVYSPNQHRQVSLAWTPRVRLALTGGMPAIQPAWSCSPQPLQVMPACVAPQLSISIACAYLHVLICRAHWTAGGFMLDVPKNPHPTELTQPWGHKLGRCRGSHKHMLGTLLFF